MWIKEQAEFTLLSRLGIKNLQIVLPLYFPSQCLIQAKRQFVVWQSGFDFVKRVTVAYIKFQFQLADGRWHWVKIFAKYSQIVFGGLALSFAYPSKIFNSEIAFSDANCSAPLILRSRAWHISFWSTFRPMI